MTEREKKPTLEYGHHRAGLGGWSAWDISLFAVWIVLAFILLGATVISIAIPAYTPLTFTRY